MLFYLLPYYTLSLHANYFLSNKLYPIEVINILNTFATNSFNAKLIENLAVESYHQVTQAAQRINPKFSAYHHSLIDLMLSVELPFQQPHLAQLRWLPNGRILSGTIPTLFLRGHRWQLWSQQKQQLLHLHSFNITQMDIPSGNRGGAETTITENLKFSRFHRHWRRRKTRREYGIQ
jgi:hypothetical protein